jgi:hypothetical protein
MAEMLLAKDHDVIEAVPPDRSDQPLRESILARIAQLRTARRHFSRPRVLVADE